MDWNHDREKPGDLGDVTLIAENDHEAGQLAWLLECLTGGTPDKGIVKVSRLRLSVKGVAATHGL